MPKKTEQSFFDEEFSEGSRQSVSGFYALQISFETFRKFLRLHSPNKVLLEYGCGNTANAFDLADKLQSATGMDISSVGIKQAHDRAQHAGQNNLFFTVMDAELLGFPDHAFDLVCGTGILHHLDLPSALRELARVSKKESGMVFLEPMGHNPAINLFRALTPRLRTPDEHPLKMTDLKFIKQQLPDVEFHFFYLFALLAIPLRKWKQFEWMVAALNAIDQFLFTRVPFLRRFAWQVVFTVEPAA